MPELADMDEEQIHRHFAKALLDNWNDYLSGDVYGFIVENPKKTYTFSEEDFAKIAKGDTIDKAELLGICTEDTEWEFVDSCYGYYGNPEESGLMDEARSSAEFFAEGQAVKNA